MRKNKFNGFTMIELLVIIAIIGVLASIVLVSFRNTVPGARDSVRMADLSQTQKLLEIYYSKTGGYPFSTENFQIQDHFWGTAWEGYGGVPKDPLSPLRDYAYVGDGSSFQIYAKFELDVPVFFACSEPCGPNGDYNGGITSPGSSLIFEEPPVGGGDEGGEGGGDGWEIGGPPGQEIFCNPPVASGEQVFDVTTRDDPKITEIRVKSLNVNQFSWQGVRVKIQDLNGNPVTLVTGEVLTNSMSFPFSLSLISGTDIGGTWQGEWFNQDEYCQNYVLIINATSASGTSKVEATFK